MNYPGPNNPCLWPIERIKKAIEHLEKKNKNHIKRFGKPHNLFLAMAQDYKALLGQRLKAKSTSEQKT